MINHIYSLLPLTIPGFCFLLIAIFYAIILKRKLIETYFLSTATIILILFSSGLLNFKGSLLLGYCILFAFSLFSLFFFVRAYAKNRNIIKEISLLQGLIIIGILFAFSIFINYGRMLSLWDELTHWGSAIKNMYFLDALGTFKESTGSVGSYPPGISLFQYFWMRPFSTFTEYPAFIASNMIYFSLIIVFIKNFNLRTFLFSAAAFLIPLVVLSTFFSSIYVDTLLGALLGGILLAYFALNNNKDKIYKIVLIASIAAVLTLSKDIGLVFSTIALMVLAIDLLFFERKFTIKELFTRGFLSSKIKNFAFILAPVITVGVLRLIWTLHLKFTKAFLTSGTQINDGMSDLVNKLINGNLLPYQYETIENFRKALVEESLYPLGFTYVELLLIIIGILIVVTFVIETIKPSKKRLLFAFCGTIIGGILYTGLILFFYISIFGSYESVMLASYSRYILSYFIGIFFFLLIFILQESTSVKFKIVYLNNLRIITLVVVLFSFFFYLSYKNVDTIKIHILKARESVHNIRGMRDGYNQILIWKKYFSDIDNKDLYILSPGDQGYDYITIIHTLYPIYIEWKQDYSVALEPYFPQLNDPWTKIFTPEEWANYVIKNYKFIFVFEYDQKFKETYGHYFDELKNNSFYEVESDENGTLKIVSMPIP